MKKLQLLIALLLLASCSVKSPEFVGVKNIHIQPNQKGSFDLLADAQFHNPNLLGGKFKIDSLDVLIDNKRVSNISSKTYKVPSKKDFTIPMKIEVEKKFFIKKDNIINMIGNLLNNKLKVKYQGKIYYVSHGLKIPYKVDEEQEIKITK